MIFKRNPPLNFAIAGAAVVAQTGKTALNFLSSSQNP
jgi:hypothetical protein